MIYSYFKDSSFSGIKRDAKFYKEFLKGVPFVNRRNMNANDRGTFSFENGVHLRSLPVQNFVEYPRVKVERNTAGIIEFLSITYNH